MSLLVTASAGVALLTAGYAVGRLQPARRVSDWAHWHRYGKRPTGLRYAAVWTVLSAENIGWLIAHPVQGVHAWKHRNDPPPRSPRRSRSAVSTATPRRSDMLRSVPAPAKEEKPQRTAHGSADRRPADLDVHAEPKPDPAAVSTRASVPGKMRTPRHRTIT